MYVLVSYNDEDNQMKNDGARAVKTLNSYILYAQGQLTHNIYINDIVEDMECNKIFSRTTPLFNNL